MKEFFLFLLLLILVILVLPVNTVSNAFKSSNDKKSSYFENDSSNDLVNPEALIGETLTQLKASSHIEQV